MVCSKEALAHVLRLNGFARAGTILGFAAGFALPSVVLMMMFAQTRVFFVMARDGLLPKSLAKVHPRYQTPYVVTIVTGIGVAVAAAFLPVGKLADYSNGGTLCAFLFVACAVMALRFIDPSRRRPFKTPAVWVVAPLAAIGCLGLFAFLPGGAKTVFFGWLAIGLLVYFAWSRRNSNIAKGIIEASDPVGDLTPGLAADTRHQSVV